MPQDRIQFSVITASLNSGGKLRETYASLAGQSVPFEYIIMDGVSTDGSRGLAEELAAADARVRVFSERDRGVYDAMNKAIRLARGSFLYFLGAGDTLFPNALSDISPSLPGNLNSFVYGDCIMDGARGRGEYSKINLARLNLCHQGIFYGRDVFEICGEYDLKYRVLADWEFNMRCFGNRRVRKIYVPLLVARFEPGGISGAGDRVFREEQLTLIRRNLGLPTYLYIKLQPIYIRYRQKLRRLV